MIAPTPRGAAAGRRLVAWTLVVLCILAATVACDGGGGDRAAGGEGGNGGGGGTTSGSQPMSWAGTDPAPDIPAGLQWFNVQHPLTLADLRGKVVLLDFWTLGCINCQHIIPDLERLEAEFGDRLAVIGVHSGKYATEHDDESVREAIRRLGLKHPVVNDPDFATWDTYEVNAWPTLFIIDPAGNIAGRHSGEGVYSLFKPIVQSLVDEFGAKGALNTTPLPLAPDSTTAATVLSYPSAVLADGIGGRLFIADAGHNRILQADLDGRLQRAFGSGKEGFADGAPDEAAFRQPQGLALSEDGKTLYVADTRNHAVRAIDLGSGETRTIAGTGTQAERLPVGDAEAAKTALASPWGIAAAGGHLYITMAGVHQIWDLDLARGTIAVFAGTSREGIDDGPRRTQATLAQPSGIVTDGAALYWVDPEGSAVRTVRLGSSDAEVETLVGTGLFDYGDKDGQGKSAKLQHAQGIALDGRTLYIADTYNHRIRALDLQSHNVTTVAGEDRGWTDGRGTEARFDEPSGVSVAGGRLYVADTGNQLVRTVGIASGTVATLQLSNLGVAVTGPGARLSDSLPAVTVAPGAANMRIVLKAPAGYHLNSQGPSTLTLTSSNPAVVELGERELRWATDEAEVRIPVPVMSAPGSATITGQASLYYCREGEEALCFIQKVEVSLPVTVSEQAMVADIPFAYTLPTRGADGN